MECRETHPDFAIIGVTDIKKNFKLKERDLSGLAMETEAKPAFLGGPDKRWYKLSEVEKKAEEVDKEKEEKEVKKKAALEKKKQKKTTGLKGQQDVKKEKNGTKEKASRKVGRKASAEDEGGVDKPASAKRKRLVRADEVKAALELTEDEDAMEEPKRKRGRPAKVAKQ